MAALDQYKLPGKTQMLVVLAVVVVVEVHQAEQLVTVALVLQDKVMQAVARVRGIPQSGKAPATGEKVFAERFKPFLEQGTTRILKFT